MARHDAGRPRHDRTCQCRHRRQPDVRGAALSGSGTLRRMAPRSLTATVVVGQEPGVRVEEELLGALPRSPTFAPWSVNIYEFPAR